MKRAVSLLLIAASAIATSLAISEVFLRLNPRFGCYIYDSFYADGKDKMAEYISTYRYRPSALLGYEHIPDGPDSRINSYGLVGKQHGLNKEKGTCRILVLGDSIAGQGWSCETLEELLNRDLAPRSRYSKFEIWNSGTGSYDVRKYYLYLKSRGMGFNPDMVMIFLFMNDFALNTNVYYRAANGGIAYHFAVSEVSKTHAVSPLLLRYSYLYRFIILRLDNYLLSSRKSQGGNPQEENGRYYLGMIKQMCQARGMPLFVVVFPYLKPTDKYDKRETEQHNDIMKVVSDLRIDYLNAYGSVPQGELCNLRASSRNDEIHPNQQAHRFIAGLIYERLVNDFKDILLRQ